MPELGIEIRSCSDCRKKDVGTMLYDIIPDLQSSQSQMRSDIEYLSMMTEVDL